MTTTTLRATSSVANAWKDICAADITSAAGVNGLVRNIAGAPIEVIKGGASPPAPSDQGIVVPVGGGEFANAANIWVICRPSGSSSRVAFDVLS